MLKRARRRLPFRTWEIVVIAIAIALFVAAAFAGPRDAPPPPVAVAPSAAPPSASPGTSASAQPSPSTAASPHATAGATASPPAPTSNASPVAAADQIVAEEVGEYILVDRRPAEAGAQGGAVEAVELRYALDPPQPDTDIFHAIEIHSDGEAADARVRTFAKAMTTSGFEVEREQPLRGTDGERQGYFIALRGAEQRLLLWSNENVTFTLGGGRKSDVEAFYESLPY